MHSTSGQNTPRSSLLLRFATFLKYSAVSLSSSLIDMGMFQVFVLLLRARSPVRYIVLSTIFARIISSVYNFLMNYRVVFRAGTGTVSAADSASRNSSAIPVFSSAVRYFALVIVQMLCSAFLVNSFCRLTGMPELAVKIIVDSCLFVLSYQIQKHLVFRNRTT